MDSIYERINDDIELNEKEKPYSEIQQYYSGKTIFLTGCTGFIGKCLVEKILRTCSDITRLYILVRPKKNKLIETRMKDYFDDVVFDILRKARPNFLDQISIIEGDLLLPGLAMSPENRRVLIETVDLIIHNGAMVFFNAKISNLLNTNVLGTKEMLDLATECHHLKGFMYVSTAYSHCYLQTIEEKFYPPPADLQMVRDIIQADTENEAGLTKEALADMMHPCPNSYIFTKAIAESIVEEYARKVPFPCGVFRMSIVISSYKEPLRGWCGNLNGPGYTFAATGMGIIHTVCVAKDGKPDLIPSDMTANACLAAVWDLAENKKGSKEGCMYNYGNSTINPITYNSLRHKFYVMGSDFPSIKSIWMYFLIVTYSYPMFLIPHILFHYIPAIIADMFRLVQWKKLKYMPLLLRVERHRTEIFYFSTNNWYIKMGEMFRIWDRMNPMDQELFFCDLRKLDWDEYCFTYWRGLRLYLLKESMDNIVAARRKYRILTGIHYIALTVMILLIGYVVFGMVSALFV